MSKIITSIIICLFLSFGGTFIVNKSSKENWIMQLSYDNIERELNINYILLNNRVNLKFEKRFANFISKLDSEISLKNNPNPCSKARGAKASPKLLTKYQELRFQVTLVGKNKELMLECEKYIDKKMKNFEKINLIIAQKLFFYDSNVNKNYLSDNNKDDDFLKKKEEARTLIKRDLIDFIYDLKKGKEENKKFSQDYISKLDNLLITLMLSGFLNEEEEKYEIIDFNILDLKLIKKVTSTLSKKEESKFLLFISIFIILQTTVTLIFFRKILLVKISKGKKIKKFISKLND